jgi:hypothetical protein
MEATSGAEKARLKNLVPRQSLGTRTKASRWSRSDTSTTETHTTGF